MFKSVGTIRTEERFMYLECDRSIAKYYRHLAKKYIGLISQRHDSHISVIRTEELSEGQILSDKYSGVEVEFCGNPEYIQNNASHYWFRIISPQLEDIRMALGFCSQPIEKFDDGTIHTHPFHLTIGRIE
ncbi:MAG: hypothetical protein ACTSU6_04405 [Candidatus Njordarchaeales archaeon]